MVGITCVSRYVRCHALRTTASETIGGSGPTQRAEADERTAQQQFETAALRRPSPRRRSASRGARCNRGRRAMRTAWHPGKGCPHTPDCRPVQGLSYASQRRRPDIFPPPSYADPPGRKCAEIPGFPQGVPPYSATPRTGRTETAGLRPQRTCWNNDRPFMVRICLAGPRDS